MKIAIVGLGYVGLPLAIEFARKKANVVGLDIDKKKVDLINAGSSYIKHVPNVSISEQVASGRLVASTDFSVVTEMDAVIICVPTPLTKNREPDVSYVLKSGAAIAPHLKKGTLVSLESSTYPGTTDHDLRLVLESISGMRAGIDFHLAFSPEREDPGNPDSSVDAIPKVVGGFTPRCLAKAIEVYQTAVKELVPVSSCRSAEATKLLENIFRSVNIALVNELKLVYAAMDIDVWEVIRAAKTKPFGFMAFYPGPGLGGHCIPIDPFYLTWKAREYGQVTKFIELAGEVNAAMPLYVVNRTAEALNSVRKSVNGTNLLVIGLAYKANVDDMRESPTFLLMDEFQRRGAQISYYDTFIPEITETREHKKWTGFISVKWEESVIRSFDAVIISTAHSDVNYSQLAQWAQLIVDTRNAMRDFSVREGLVWKS